MKAFTVLAMLLAAGSAVQGRRLLQDGCSDLSILDNTPYSDIGKLIKGLNLLPNGLPADVTVFLPNNDAVNALLSLVPVQGLTVDTLLTSNLPPLIINKLVSALLYHIVPSGAYTLEELAQEMTVNTALEGYSFELMDNNGNYTITDMAGQSVNVMNLPGAVCGSDVYGIDKVLVPASTADAAGLISIPETTPQQAVAILMGGGAASPAMAPSSEGTGAMAPMADATMA